jgi:hypothetical protein
VGASRCHTNTASFRLVVYHDKELYNLTFDFTLAVLAEGDGAVAAAALSGLEAARCWRYSCAAAIADCTRCGALMGRLGSDRRGRPAAGCCDGFAAASPLCWGACAELSGPGVCAGSCVPEPLSEAPLLSIRAVPLELAACIRAKSSLNSPPSAGVAPSSLRLAPLSSLDAADAPLCAARYCSALPKRAEASWVLTLAVLAFIGAGMLRLSITASTGSNLKWWLSGTTQHQGLDMMSGTRYTRLMESHVTRARMLWQSRSRETEAWEPGQAPRRR